MATREKPSGLSTGTVGAISELQVCADLLSKGYEVFRSVSPSCSCDLAILVNNNLHRVEVRTGYIYGGNGNRWAAKPKDNSKFDVFAAVYKDRIEY